MMRALGFSLVALPFVGGLAAITFQHGLFATAIGVSAALVVMATFFAGFWLIENG